MESPPCVPASRWNVVAKRVHLWRRDSLTMSGKNWWSLSFVSNSLGSKTTERELKHTSRSEKTQTQKWKNLNLSSRWHCLSTHKKENMQIKGKWNFPFSYFFSFSLRFQGGSEGTKRKENPFISIIYTCVHPEAIGKISLTSFVLFFHSTGFLYTIIRNETHGCGPIYMNGYLSTCTFSTTTTNVVYTHTAHLECSVKTSPIWVGTLTTP